MPIRGQSGGDREPAGCAQSQVLNLHVCICFDHESNIRQGDVPGARRGSDTSLVRDASYFSGMLKKSHDLHIPIDSPEIEHLHAPRRTLQQYRCDNWDISLCITFEVC